MLSLIVAARGEAGPATSFYHNLPLRDLSRWHVEAGDFEEDGGLLYKAGLLYGIDLASHVASGIDVKAVELEDMDAFNGSVQYLYDSYRGLDDRDREALNWRRQKARELLYTGSDILTLANAALSEGVHRRLQELGSSDPGKSNLAQHVGIVDGAILIDAYRSFAMGGEPQKFEQPKAEYAPSFSGTHYRSHFEMSTARPYSYERLEQLLDVKELENNVNVQLPLVGNSSITEHIIRRYVQIGPNSFVLGDTVDAVSVPRMKLRNLAGYLATGLTLDVIQGGILDRPPGYIPVSAAFLGIVGIWRQRQVIAKAKRQAEGYELPLTIRSVEV